jgi:hypothetical protein
MSGGGSIGAWDRTQAIDYTGWGWNANPGGYGTSGYTGGYSLSGIISSYNPNYGGPVYVNSGGSTGHFALPTQLAWAQRQEGTPFNGTIEYDRNEYEANKLYVSNGIVKGYDRLLMQTPAAQLAAYYLANANSRLLLADCPKCKSQLEKIWNSELMRMLIPDNITLDVNYGTFLGRGGSLTYTANILTRGKYPGIYVTRTYINTYGAEISYGVNLGIMHYKGDIRTMQPSSLLGPAGNISGGYMGVGMNFNTGYEDINSSLLKPAWFGFSAGVGATVGLSGGTGTTTPVGMIIPVGLIFIPVPWK